MCQRTNTAIYAFRAEREESLFSTGPRILAELTSETGGRVFHDDDSAAGIDSDLRTIEADLRNQYRLVYKPAELKHDGSFHRIELKAPERVDSIIIRSGLLRSAAPFAAIDFRHIHSRQTFSVRRPAYRNLCTPHVKRNRWSRHHLS
jgi:hypothetical protein